MFGANEIIGAKFFEKIGSHTLLVASRFFTLQGEGPLQGQPSVFLRLAKCNLACSFCDTYFDTGTPFSFTQLRDELDRVILHHFKVSKESNLPGWARNTDNSTRQINLVVTGGEPTLQQNLLDFLEYVHDEWTAIQIESNGIIHREWEPDTILIVSPKCLPKADGEEGYIKPHKKTLKRANALKFVLSADIDSPYNKIPEWAFEWRKEKGGSIYVSPMNTYTRLPNQAQRKIAGPDADIETRSLVDEVISFWDQGLLDMEKNRKNHEHAARYALDNGLFLTLQMHLLAGLA